MRWGWSSHCTDAELSLRRAEEVAEGHVERQWWMEAGIKGRLVGSRAPALITPRPCPRKGGAVWGGAVLEVERKWEGQRLHGCFCCCALLPRSEMKGSHRPSAGAQGEPAEATPQTGEGGKNSNALVRGVRDNHRPHLQQHLVNAERQMLPVRIQR